MIILPVFNFDSSSKLGRCGILFKNHVNLFSNINHQSSEKKFEMCLVQVPLQYFVQMQVAVAVWLGQDGRVLDM